MAVILCKNCGAKVNSEAVACPECGADPRTGEGGSPSGQAPSNE
jgi:RNA polymerase subunit RPABC4/transcription elongation factor Spt4